MLKRHLIFKRLLIIITILTAVYLLLLIPADTLPGINSSSFRTPFIWNRDSLWNSLEQQFANSIYDSTGKSGSELDFLFSASDKLLDSISDSSLNPSDLKFSLLENYIFHIAPLIPSNSWRFNEFGRLNSKIRRVMKKQSTHWDMTDPAAKNIMYRLLYGSRTALEEIMLQLKPEMIPSLIMGTNEPSATPSARILGVEIHSGDILVSRGGAATSALIARGSDYPGNFSHIAFVHINEKTNLISIIESHIETGVKISSLNEYLNDTKLRIMVLRLRQEVIKQEQMLPHKAAEYALLKAGKGHIPYDFEMDFKDPSKLFCSEVVSAAYKHFGITLWKSLSVISSKGTRNWLSAFGVRNFETQEPSDLEYDPQLAVVAEWRDAETLYKDHLDNAVTDIMLEQADSGKVLTYDWYMLPPGRITKLYSMILNFFGSAGPVPEGMSTEAALKNLKYTADHKRIEEKLRRSADDFKRVKGYTPPYWQLVNLARKSG